MRKLYCVLFISLFAITTIETSAQTTYVPDDNFEQALIDLGYDTGVLDDYIPTVNIDTVTSLDVHSKNIFDLTGIEDFVALKELDCSYNDLTNLDLSANLSLLSLNCYRSNLTSLNVSSNIALIELNCGNNSLTSLNVSANTALTSLNCSPNQLTSLDVSANIALTYLGCGLNQLTSLDVSANTALTGLSCYRNQLTSLDISLNTALTGLYCYENQLTSIDVTVNTALSNIWCHANQLTNIDVTTNTALTNLNCGSNQLTSLDVSANTALTVLICENNQLISLDLRNGNNININHFKAQDNPDLSCIYVDDKKADYLSDWSIDESAEFLYTEAECGGEPLSYIPDNNFEQALIDLGYDAGTVDSYVPTGNINTITDLNVGNKNIFNLKGIEDFITLTNLDCNSNQLTAIDISENTSLIHLDCSSNLLSTLNVLENTSLTDLDCSNNQLSILDVTFNTALTGLFCSNNQLLNIDIRNEHNNNITDFYANENPNLTCILVDDKTASYLSGWTKEPTAQFLDSETECGVLTFVPDDNFEQALIDLGYDMGVINNYVLTESIDTVTSIDIRYNDISELTGIEDFISLTNLSCYGNNLSTLDVSNLTSLTSLGCGNNNLTSLDVSANTALRELSFNSNSITNIDLSSNTLLTDLSFGTTLITTIDISSNIALEYLSCGFNGSLLSLDLSNNLNLTTLYCNYASKLSTLDLSANTALTTLSCYNINLTSIDLRNGNNENITNFNATNNPYLTCIYVDDKTETYLSDWNIDATSSFVNDETECLTLKTYVPDNSFEQALIDLGFDSGDLDDYVATASIDTITSINVSNESISDLTGIKDFVALIELNCNNNQLTVLDFRNGNNANITSFDASNNSNLACIYVDDKTASYLSDWTKDATSNFVNDEADCSAITSLDEIITKADYTIYPNPTNGILKFDFSGINVQKIKISDITGKTVFEKVNVEQNEVIDLSGFANGIYIVTLQTDKGSTSSKIIKE